jgi:hypothetical protein
VSHDVEGPARSKSSDPNENEANRGVEARTADVRRWLEASRRVYADRSPLMAAIVRTTGLTPEGVELGFASLERDATEEHLRSLVAAAGRTPRVHVVLSANVFVAPLRAIVLARAAAERVTVRPSPRDPVLARALVEVAGDAAVELVDERDIGGVEAGEIHVYGRDASIAAVRARARPSVAVRAHGPGMGAAFVSRGAHLADAAAGVAVDVIAFDQRGCSSPRVVLVEGDDARGGAFAEALHESLSSWGARVPRGALRPEEVAAAARWQDALAFAGRIFDGAQHVVALGPSGGGLAVPPDGRHVLVVAAPSREAGATRLAPLAPFLVAVGTDVPAEIGSLAPAHARISELGAMQRPPLDGPIDRRP